MTYHHLKGVAPSKSGILARAAIVLTWVTIALFIWGLVFSHGKATFNLIMDITERI